MPTLENVTDIPVTVTVFNLGVSPALKAKTSDPIVALDTDSDMVEHMRTCSLTYPEGEGLPLPPNQSLTSGSGITTHTIVRHLSDEQRKDVVVNKTKRLIVLGGVKYSGVRGGEYETIYCYAWNPGSLNANIFPWGSVNECPCNRMN
jgi:hypothetical protein